MAVWIQKVGVGELVGFVRHGQSLTLHVSTVKLHVAVTRHDQCTFPILFTPTTRRSDYPIYLIMSSSHYPRVSGSFPETNEASESLPEASRLASISRFLYHVCHLPAHISLMAPRHDPRDKRMYIGQPQRWTLVDVPLSSYLSGGTSVYG